MKGIELYGSEHTVRLRQKYPRAWPTAADKFVYRLLDALKNTITHA